MKMTYLSQRPLGQSATPERQLLAPVIVGGLILFGIWLMTK